MLRGFGYYFFLHTCCAEADPALSRFLTRLAGWQQGQDIQFPPCWVRKLYFLIFFIIFLLFLQVPAFESHDDSRDILEPWKVFWTHQGQDTSLHTFLLTWKFCTSFTLNDVILRLDETLSGEKLESTFQDTQKRFSTQISKTHTKSHMKQS